MIYPKTCDHNVSIHEWCVWCDRAYTWEMIRMVLGYCIVLLGVVGVALIHYLKVRP